MGSTWNERDGSTENTSMGYELQMNDFLQTGEDGGMILKYVDNTKFTMGPNTELILMNLLLILLLYLQNQQ